MNNPSENWLMPNGNSRSRDWRKYVAATVVVAGCSILAGILFPFFSPENLSMIFLAGIVVSALYYGRGPSIWATILSVAIFDVIFIEPYGTFAISDVQYVFTLLVMLLVAITVSTLAASTKQQTEIARERERRTAILYAMNRKLANAQNVQELITLGAQHIGNELNSPTEVFVFGATGEVTMEASSLLTTPSPNLGIAQWTFNSGLASGYGTDNIPDTPYMYLPLKALQNTVGVLAIFTARQPQFLSVEGRRFLETLADQFAVSIERMNLAAEAQNARTQAESERLRNSLLSSVSHDLRTPLASIMGAASTLLEKGLTLEAKAHEELAQVAFEEAQRLNRLVGNLLDMTRLESGGFKIEKEWQTVEEVLGSTLRYLGKRRGNHIITANLAQDLPLVPMDSILIEQVLLNLLDNAIKYTPSETRIEISASATDEAVQIEIGDHGPGIKPGDEEKIFDKFYRSSANDTSGVGLGLAICKGIVEAHGGTIQAKNRPMGGAIFSITLPIDGHPPEVSEE